MRTKQSLRTYIYSLFALVLLSSCSSSSKESVNPQSLELQVKHKNKKGQIHVTGFEKDASEITVPLEGGVVVVADLIYSQESICKAAQDQLQEHPWVLVRSDYKPSPNNETNPYPVNFYAVAIKKFLEAEYSFTESMFSDPHRGLKGVEVCP